MPTLKVDKRAREDGVLAQDIRQTSRTFEKLFNIFWNHYLDERGDEEMLKIIQPFYAWRGLVVASPIWYPHLLLDTRTKLQDLGKKVLQTECFNVENVNLHIKD